MAKFRKRIKSSKGKRWPKGQSSSSNPSSKTYREAAKSRFFQPLTGPSNLTQEAVRKHDDVISVKSVDSDSICEDDIESYGGKTFKTFDTFASDWSACSNQSFSKLVDNFRADSLMHKDMLAVLAAVTQVIKENGGEETSTEYFAALTTALESENNTDDTIAAILNLLSMGIKSVPETVLLSKFSESSKILVKILARFSQSEKTSVLRAIIGCLSVLLRAQDVASWSNAYTLHVLNSILTFVSFSKPKVRKAAQHGITVIARGSKIPPSGLAHIAKHCNKLLESVTSGGLTTTLHVLNLLKDIMHVFPKKELKECVETVLKVMTLNNIHLTTCSLRALHGMWLGRPGSLPPPRAARLLNALYDFQPPPTDGQPTQAWLAVLQEAYLFLNSADIGLCVANLGRLMTSCTELFTSDRPEILTATTHTLQTVLSECLRTASRTPVLPRFQTDIAHIVDRLQACLSYQYNPAWTHILHLISAVFKTCGDTCAGVLLPCVKTLVELRDSDQFTFTSELENAIGCAVKSIGPEMIIKVAPLQLNLNDKKREFKRSWLLPVLKDNIRGSTLQTFRDHFLPLAAVCKNEAERLKKANDQIGALSYDLLQSQIWSLLPSFATQPTDIALSFPGIAKVLGDVLGSRKDLRLFILSTLRKLVVHSMERSTEEGYKEDLATMSKFAKNYLPILCRLYTTKAKGTDEEGSRLACYETLKIYLKIAPQPVTKELYDTAFKKVETQETEELVRESVLDLIRALLPYQQKEDLKVLYDRIAVCIEECPDHRQQKKYYRLLEEICTSETPVLNEFLNENITNIQDIVVNSLSKAAPSSKGARLRCIQELLKHVEDRKSLALGVLAEVVLCVKDVNTRCRQTAYQILEWVSSAVDLDQCLPVVLAGLAGTPSTISCSLQALAALAYHARDKLPEDVEKSLLYNAGLLAVCTTREVVSSALCFFKVYIQAFPRAKVYAFLPRLMRILSQMPEDCKRHTRNKTRDMLSRLTRWFGTEEVLRHIPKDDEVLKTRVKNLGKINARKKRQWEEEKASRASSTAGSSFTVASKHKSIEEILAESDSDMDVDEDETEKQTKKKTRTWITEEPEDIVDFTDVSATRKITATKPGSSSNVPQKKHIRRKDEFKVAPDGRLIITDDGRYDEEDGESGAEVRRKKKSIIPGLDDSDDDYEISEDEEGASSAASAAKGAAKRARSVSSFASTSQPNKYQAGGKGIHRPIFSSKSKQKKKTKKSPGVGPLKTGKEYRARKAGGDMKRKGMPDPFAYLPLRRDALNKRKKMKALGQMKNLLKSAQKGAKIGAMQRRKK